jgi:hypothetical protein
MRTIAIAIIASAALGVMGFINWTMAQSPVSTAPILAQSQQQEVPSAESTVGDPKLDPISLLQASQRPLFAQDRKPWVMPQKTAAAPLAEMPSEVPALLAAPLPNLTLLGIQKSPNGPTVLLMSELGTEPIWLKEGEVYESWQVRNIDSHSVNLASGVTKLTLELYPSANMVLSPP